MSEEQLWSIPDDVESIYIHYTTEDLLKGFREEALRHREEISQLKNQLQQKENIIKEVREYIEQCQLGEDSEGRPYMLANQEEGQELLGILDKES